MYLKPVAGLQAWIFEKEGIRIIVVHCCATYGVGHNPMGPLGPKGHNGRLILGGGDANNDVKMNDTQTSESTLEPTRH